MRTESTREPNTPASFRRMRRAADSTTTLSADLPAGMSMPIESRPPRLGGCQP